jgi:competence ComEA-like helix-hairpin-helix protein
MRPMVERKSAVFGALMLAGFVSAPLVPAMAIGFHQDPQKAEARSPEDIKGEETFTRNCVKCHPVDRIAGSRRTRTQWEEVMTTMTTARGAVISDEDWDVIQTYLVRHYGRVNVNRATADDLAEVLGVTPETANAIVAYRKQNGEFVDYDAFAKVPGLDLEKLEKLRDAISF